MNNWFITNLFLWKLFLFWIITHIWMKLVGCWQLLVLLGVVALSVVCLGQGTFHFAICVHTIWVWNLTVYFMDTQTDQWWGHRVACLKSVWSLSLYAQLELLYSHIAPCGWWLNTNDTPSSMLPRQPTNLNHPYDCANGVSKTLCHSNCMLWCCWLARCSYDLVVQIHIVLTLFYSNYANVPFMFQILIRPFDPYIWRPSH